MINAKEAAMTIENPSAADVRTLKVGATIRINGRTKYTVTAQMPYSVCIEGARGGWANLVPSTCEKAVQLTTISKRDWIRTLEVL